MSDGRNDATPDHRRASDGAPNPQPTLGAAPWERFSTPSSDVGPHQWSVEPPSEPSEPIEPSEPDATEPEATEKVGNHTAGAVSVADLIAKIGAPPADRPTRHQVEPDTEADIERDGVVTDEDDDDLQDTQVITTPAYSFDLFSELPDLGARNYPHSGDDDPEPESEQTSEAGPAPALARTRRIRSRSAPEGLETRKPKRESGRRPMLLAGRSLAALAAVLALVLTGGAWQWSTS
jgi:hypothetical protein